jgi:uncharacterized protein (UPF0147 family)
MRSGLNSRESNQIDIRDEEGPMEQKITLRDQEIPKLLGQIEITPMTDGAAIPSREVLSEYAWTPSVEFQSEYPVNYRLRMKCRTSQSGQRRFEPLGLGDAVFLLYASSGGMAVLTNSWTSSTDDASEWLSALKNYRFQQLIFQWSFNAKRKLKREILRIQDVELQPNERTDSSTETILPDCLAPGNQHESATERQHAMLLHFKNGFKNPRGTKKERRQHESEFIRQRIRSLARADPMRIQGRDSAGAHSDLVRESIRNEIDLGQVMDPKAIQEVRDRLWDAYQKHDHLNTAEFHAWFFKNLDNMVRSISKRVAVPFELTRKQVQQGFSEMIWDAQKATSFLVQQQMREFKASLDQPLSAEESVAFDALYEAHYWSGGLIPMMFYAHSELLRPLMDELQSPDCCEAARTAFATAVYLKTTMVKNRREADRIRKKQTTEDKETHRRDFQRAADLAGAIQTSEEQNEAKTEAIHRKLSSLIALSGSEAAQKVRKQLEGMRNPADRQRDLQTICNIGTDEAIGIVTTCFSNASVKPAVRIEALQELIKCPYSEQICKLLQATIVDNANVPRIRIAATKALDELHRQHSKAPEIAAAIAERIEVLTAEKGLPQRVRSTIMSVASQMHARIVETTALKPRSSKRKRPTRGRV